MVQSTLIWASDTNHCKSVTGVIIQYAGGIIYFKTKSQHTIIMTSQDEKTTLCIDNKGVLLMTNAQKSTRFTWHMDIKHFALLYGVERYLVVMKRINTSEKCWFHGQISQPQITLSILWLLYIRGNSPFICSSIQLTITPYYSMNNSVFLWATLRHGREYLSTYVLVPVSPIRKV